MTTEQRLCPVKFTSGALQEIHRLMTKPDFDKGQVLRVGVKGGGCSGLSYLLGFDQPEPDDQLFETEGISVVIKPAHSLYLTGMEIDFQHGLNARGFHFQNPNASDTCGCGSSFAV